MKRLLYVVLSVIIAFGLGVPLATPASAANYTVSANTNWSALVPAPTTSDTVTVNNGAVLTVDAPAATAGTIQLGGVTGEGQLTFTAAGNLTVGTALEMGDLTNFSGGNIDMTAGGTLRINGAFNYNLPGAVDWVPGTGTVEYNGTVPQTVTALAYNHLAISGASTKTLDFIVNVQGNFIIGAGSTVVAGSLLLVGGNWTNNGTFNGTTNLSLVQMAGSAAQTLTGATTFYDFEVDNAAGLTINNNITVNNIAYFTNGKITTAANSVIIGTSGSVTRTNGYVIGNLQKYVPTGATSRTFELGTATGYTPVTIAFGSVTVAGNLTAKATAGQHPNILSSSIISTKDVNVYWSLTNSGITFTNYSATFNFNAGDVLGGANTVIFIVGKYDAPNWTYPAVGTKTATSTQATGLTAFSDFTVGEPYVATKISFTTGAQTFAAGTASGVITVQTQDATNTAVNALADRTVNLTSSSATGRFDTNPAGAFDGSITSVTITTGTNSANFYYKDTAVGTPTITAASAGLTSGTQQETITASAPAKIAFITGTQTVTAGSVSNVITIQTQDANNNPSDVVGITAVNLTSDSVTGRFDTSPVGAFDGSITSVNIAAGSNSASFYYKDPTAGTPTITAASVGLTSGTQLETISATAVPSKIGFTTGAQSITAGAASTIITIQTQDNAGSPADVAGNTTINLTSSSATGMFDTNPAGAFDGSITSVVITTATNTISFYYKDTAAGTPTITAASAGLTSGTQQETIVAGNPTQIVFTTAPQTITAFFASLIMTVQTQDANGNPANVAALTTINLSSSSVTGRFDTSTAGLFDGSITSVNIAAGSNSASFYYKDITAGSPTITAASAGLTSGTQIETITAAPTPAKIAFTTVAQTISVGAASGIITIQTQDNAGNPAIVTLGTVINLTFHLAQADSILPLPELLMAL